MRKKTPLNKYISLIASAGRRRAAPERSELYRQGAACVNRKIGLGLGAH